MCSGAAKKFRNVCSIDYGLVERGRIAKETLVKNCPTFQEHREHAHGGIEADNSELVLTPLVAASDETGPLAPIRHRFLRQDLGGRVINYCNPLNKV